MRFGDTLMIGGLISSRKNGSKSEIPILGEIPLIGAAFRRVSYEEAETELLILVTPHMVSPMDPTQVPPGGPGLNSSNPTTHELFIDGHLEVDNFGGYQGGPIAPGVMMPGPGMLPPGPAMPPPGLPAPPPPAAPPTLDMTRSTSPPSGVRPASATQPPQRRTESRPPGLIGPQ